MPATIQSVAAGVEEIACRWGGERPERQTRRRLERADFEALRSTGLLTMMVPVEHGGLASDLAGSLRPTAALYRRLGSADPSVALVSAMHPAVLCYWLANPDPSHADWEEQRRAVFASAVAGEQWGTITSEPGSGGDIARTRAVATPQEGASFLPGRTYGVSGDKHFGSGSGIADRMVTTAVAEGESDPMVFVLDVRDRPWDASAGLELLAEWDGMGMRATQSHAMRLVGAPSVRMEWHGRLDAVSRGAGPFVGVLFTSVVLGVLDEAVTVARRHVTTKADELRPYEQVEWARAEQDHWLAVQAYEGALRAVEGGDPRIALHAALRAKEAVADLAEQTLLRLTRVIGGGTYSQRSPFAHWFEDVRALGFLRPPWGLAYDNLFASSLESP